MDNVETIIAANKEVHYWVLPLFYINYFERFWGYNVIKMKMMH